MNGWSWHFVLCIGCGVINNFSPAYRNDSVSVWLFSISIANTLKYLFAMSRMRWIDVGRRNYGVAVGSVNYIKWNKYTIYKWHTYFSSLFSSKTQWMWYLCSRDFFFVEDDAKIIWLASSEYCRCYCILVPTNNNIRLRTFVCVLFVILKKRRTKMLKEPIQPVHVIIFTHSSNSTQNMVIIKNQCRIDAISKLLLIIIWNKLLFSTIRLFRLLGIIQK